jgi:peroxiredoxin (alkyl hydroperoxide reductase subunit C)
MNQELTAIGQQAPDFTLRDQDNKPVTLSQFRGQRNVVLYFTREFM